MLLLINNVFRTDHIAVFVYFVSGVMHALVFVALMLGFPGCVRHLVQDFKRVLRPRLTSWRP